MEFHTVPAAEAAVRRYVEELWLPYHRDLSAAAADHGLADADIVDAEVEFRLDMVDSETYELLVALEPTGDGSADTDFAEIDGDLLGFITTNIDEAPEVFDRPDRLLIGDFYVVEDRRGSGLAEQLVARALERAKAEGYPEFTLEVDVDNDRAIAFYEKLGFEPARWEMHASTEEIEAALE